MLPFIQSTYLKSLLESLSEGVVIMNVKGDVYAANETAGRMLGVDGDALLDGPLNGPMLERFSDSAEVRGFLDRARRPEASRASMQARFGHPGGGLRLYTLAVSRLVEYGKVFGIVLQIGDITDIFEMHEREKRMLEERNAIQQERIDSMAQLSMSLAHQIRNPLMTIGGFAQLLERKSTLDAVGAEFVHNIQEGARRLEAVVNAVTEYTASRTVAYRLTDVAALVRSVSNRLAPLPSTVLFQAPEHGPMWSIDPDLTADALFEVLQNAVEATTPQGGQVRVLWREEQAAHVLEILDQGLGVAAETAPFVFDPFFTTKAVGVGMGLAKARRWVREQGGELFLSTSEEGGAKAVVRFPVDLA